MQKIIIINQDEAEVVTKVTQALDEAGVNIKSLDTERIGEQSIISLTTNDADLALQALARAGFHAGATYFQEKDETPPKVVELPATPELLARVDLSHNGTDMLCARGGLFGPRCQEPPVTVFLCAGFLWPGCQEHKDQLRWALSIMPTGLPAY
jgi:hypothetical protein